MPFDQFTIEQLAGDLLPNPHPRSAGGHRLQSLQHHHQRRRTYPGGISRSVYARPHRDDGARLARPDRQLRGLPRSQVRSDHARKSFMSCRRSSITPRRPRWTATSRTRRPSMLVPRRRIGRAGTCWRKRAGGSAQTSRRAQAAARADFDKWLASATPADRRRDRSRATGLRLHAALNEGKGKTVHSDGGRQAAIASRWRRAPPGTPATSPPRRSRVSRAAPSKWRTPAISRRTGLFLRGLGEAHQGAADRRRSSPAWTIRTTTAAGICGLQGGRVGAHIIHKWPEDALKVVSKKPIKAAQWNHLFVTYDGSGKPGGVKVYVNGAAQETNVEAGKLKSTIRTNVPLKIGPASHDGPAGRHRLAGRAAIRPHAVAGWKSSGSSRGTRGGVAAASRRRSAPTRRKTSCSTGG